MTNFVKVRQNKKDAGAGRRRLERQYKSLKCQVGYRSQCINLPLPVPPKGQEAWHLQKRYRIPV